MGTKSSAEVLDQLDHVAASESMTDSKASGQLRVLFATYNKYRKERPKSPSEAATLPLIAYNPDGIKPLLVAFVEKFEVWTVKMNGLMQAIAGIGQANPGASVTLVSKAGRAFSINGTRLFSALVREDADILTAKLNIVTPE